MVKYRIYKISINILIFHVFTDSKELKINNLFIHILYSTWYVLIALLFGWWGLKFIFHYKDLLKNLEALHVNLSGGIDCSKEMSELDYDPKTNFVWNNLLRDTIKHLRKDDVEIILELQNNFETLNTQNYGDENLEYLFKNLARIDLRNIIRSDIEDVFDAIKLYKLNIYR